MSGRVVECVELVTWQQLHGTHVSVQPVQLRGQRLAAGQLQEGAGGGQADQDSVRVEGPQPRPPRLPDQLLGPALHEEAAVPSAGLRADNGQRTLMTEIRLSVLHVFNEWESLSARSIDARGFVRK